MAGASAGTAIAAARALLARAERVLVLTGAGVSRAAGIKTFAELEAEDPAGLAWARSSGARLLDQPCAVWGLMESRRQVALRAAPTAAHRAIAAWAARRPGVTVATQNVDGLHERAAREAGADPAAVIRLHGTLLEGHCVACGRPAALPPAIDATARERLPACAACGALVRPSIVWFGEQLHPAALIAAAAAADACQACLVVGTRLDVYPAAWLPGRARTAGAALIEVNPQPAMEAGDGVIPIAAGADAAVPELLA